MKTYTFSCRGWADRWAFWYRVSSAAVEPAPFHSMIPGVEIDVNLDAVDDSL